MSGLFSCSRIHLVSVNFYAEKLPGCNLHVVSVPEAKMLAGKGVYWEKQWKNYNESTRLNLGLLTREASFIKQPDLSQ